MQTNEADDLTQHIPALQRFARSLTKDAAAADDLVQDTVERALTRWHLYEAGTNLRAWLFTICRRLFLNECRRSSTRGVHVDYEDVKSAIPVKAMQDLTLEVKDVQKAFSKLPMKDKVILSLITLEGLKYKEAAVLLDMPIGTVRSRLSRARNRLMAAVEGVQPQNGEGAPQARHAI